MSNIKRNIKQYTFHPNDTFQLDADYMNQNYGDGCQVVFLTNTQINILLAMSQTFLRFRWVWGFKPNLDYMPDKKEEWKEILNLVSELEFNLMCSCNASELVSSLQDINTTLSSIDSRLQNIDQSILSVNSSGKIKLGDLRAGIQAGLGSSLIENVDGLLSILLRIEEVVDLIPNFDANMEVDAVSLIFGAWNGLQQYYRDLTQQQRNVILRQVAVALGGATFSSIIDSVMDAIPYAGDIGRYMTSFDDIVQSVGDDIWATLSGRTVVDKINLVNTTLKEFKECCNGGVKSEDEEIIELVEPIIQDTAKCERVRHVIGSITYMLLRIQEYGQVEGNPPSELELAAIVDGNQDLADYLFLIFVNDAGRRMFNRVGQTSVDGLEIQTSPHDYGLWLTEFIEISQELADVLYFSDEPNTAWLLAQRLITVKFPLIGGEPYKQQEKSILFTKVLSRSIVNLVFINADYSSSFYATHTDVSCNDIRVLIDCAPTRPTTEIMGSGLVIGGEVVSGVGFSENDGVADEVYEVNFNGLYDVTIFMSQDLDASFRAKDCDDCYGSNTSMVANNGLVTRNGIAGFQLILTSQETFSFGAVIKLSVSGTQVPEYCA